MWASVADDRFFGIGRARRGSNRAAQRDEVATITGRTADGSVDRAHRAGQLGGRNYGFDVTPARLVTRLVTDAEVVPEPGGADRGFAERVAAAIRNRRAVDRSSTARADGMSMTVVLAVTEDVLRA